MSNGVALARSRESVPPARRATFGGRSALFEKTGKSLNSRTKRGISEPILRARDERVKSYESLSSQSSPTNRQSVSSSPMTISSPSPPPPPPPTSSSSLLSSLIQPSRDIFDMIRDITNGNKDYPTKRWTRSYVSNPQLMVDSWRTGALSPPKINASLFLEDRTDESKYFSVVYQGFLIVGTYFVFPFFQRLIAPTLAGINVDDITASVTGAFSPAMDVLYALLASTTVSLLQARQEKIQDAVNAELNQLRILTWLIIQLAQDYEGKRRTQCEELLVYVWQYVDLLIFSSRAQELEGVVEDDLLLKLHHGLHVVQIADDSVSSKVLVERIHSTAAQGKITVENIMGNRTLRLDKEGQGVVPAILAITDLLALYIIVSFTLLSSALELEPISMLGPMQSLASILLSAAHYVDSKQVGVGNGFSINAEAALFATLTSALLTIRSLYLDLERPFRGHSRVRRTVSSSSIFAIRSDIERELLKEEETSFLQKLRESSNAAFLDYKIHKGKKG
eukprot:CAMPEP_0184485722 /NCGR_PEP_ID=MMETSP0113_2-20130426/7298_1 /TAXON_ID=91329 /ORGANISM="Norrisiella sphaerica, Strain BC52" /LENGTH=507 /DNA_ID=CAMNT_0026867299 /DNA_START=92 /DNA_END=1615 /DNA_ORIENTATION=-